MVCWFVSVCFQPSCILTDSSHFFSFPKKKARPTNRVGLLSVQLLLPGGWGGVKRLSKCHAHPLLILPLSESPPPAFAPTLNFSKPIRKLPVGNATELKVAPVAVGGFRHHLLYLSSARRSSLLQLWCTMCVSFFWFVCFLSFFSSLSSFPLRRRMSLALGPSVHPRMKTL